MDELTCEFCNNSILKKQVIYKDNKILVLYPRKPVILEHLIVIPVRHVETFEELSNQEFLESAKVIKRIFKSFKNKRGASGFNLFTNIGEKAGQHIVHFHWHVFIRFDEEKISPYKILNDSSLREEITSKEWEKRRDSVSSIIVG